MALRALIVEVGTFAPSVQPSHIVRGKTYRHPPLHGSSGSDLRLNVTGIRAHLLFDGPLTPPQFEEWKNLENSLCTIYWEDEADRSGIGSALIRTVEGVLQGQVYQAVRVTVTGDPTMLDQLC